MSPVDENFAPNVEEKFAPVVEETPASPVDEIFEEILKETPSQAVYKSNTPSYKRTLGGNDENIAEARRAAELAAMNIVMEIEINDGFTPKDVSSQKIGYDILSTSAGKVPHYIEVKGRSAEQPTVTVSYNEIVTALKYPDKFILALVLLDGGHSRTYYIRRPFEQPPDKSALSVNFSIEKLLQNPTTQKKTEFKSKVKTELKHITVLSELVNSKI